MTHPAAAPVEMPSVPLPGWRLRPADAADSALLLAWRNEPAARQASHQQDLVTPEVHARWFAASLASASRRILMAERAGVPVAMARLDQEGDGWQLSWYVDAAARGQGVGQRLLASVLATVSGPVRAEIKRDNLASLRIAEAVGFRQHRVEGSVVHCRFG